jgi:hypothetical protein
VHDVGRGLYFVDDVRPYTGLYRNAMSDNQTGLYLDNAKIGAQGFGTNPRDNTWDTGTSWSPTNPHIMCDASDGADSPFHVYDTGAEYYPTHRAASFGVAVPTPTTTSTASTDACPVFTAPSFKTGEAEEEVSPLTEALRLLDAAQVQETHRDSTMRWASQYGLYKRLLADMELLTSNQVLNSFFQQQQEGSMGQLHRAMATFRTLRNGEADQWSAMDNLQQVQPQNRAEQRLKEVLGILYSHAQDLTQLQEDQVQRLRDMALLCPLDDGFAVHMARSALMAVDTLPRVYTSICEQEMTERKRDLEETSDNRDFSVYPNPNNGQMTVSYNLEEGENGHLFIYSTLGELVFQRPLNGGSNQMEVDVIGMSSGIYLLKIDVNGNQRLTQRVSILGE